MMSNNLFFIVLLGSVVLVASDLTTISFNPITRQITRDGKACLKEGFMCETCKIVSECIDLGGTFLKQEVYTCDASSCLTSTGNCTEEPNPECDDNINKYKLICRQLGVFPHPFNMCKYLMCVPGSDIAINPVAVELSCLAGYAFDPLTGLCRVKLPDEECPMLIEPCATPTQRGGIPGHPSMYYICLKNDDKISLPQLFVCPKDQVYNETKKGCEEAALPDSGLDAEGTCLAKGLFYSSSSCFDFIECTALGGLPAKRACAAKMYFSLKLKRCVDFTCTQV